MESKLTKKQKTESEAINPDHTQEAKTDAKQPLPIPENFPIRWTHATDSQGFWGQMKTIFPQPLTPLGYDLVVKPMLVGLQQATDTLQANFRSFPGLFNYYLYANNTCSEDILRYDEEVLNEKVEQLETQWQESVLPEIQTHLEIFSEEDLSQVSWSELLGRLEEFCVRIQRLWDLHGEIANPMLLTLHQFEEMYQDLLADLSAYNAYELLEKEPSKTAHISHDLLTLSQQAAQDSELMALFLTTPEEELVETIRQTSFWSQIESYLAQHGQQSRMYYIRVPTWQENPLPVLQNLKSYLQQEKRHPESTRQENKERTNQAIQEAREQLKDYPQPIVDEFERLLKLGQFANYLREEHAHWLDLPITFHARRMALVVGQHLVAKERIDLVEDVFYLYLEEVKQEGDRHQDYRPLISARRQELDHFAQIDPPPLIGMMPNPMPVVDAPLVQANMKHSGMSPPSSPNETGPDLIVGHAGAPGTVKGWVKILKSPTEIDKLRGGDILVTVTTTPDWSPCFVKISGLITDTGGVLSHAAVVAREFGIPAVVGTGHATSLLQDNQIVELNGNTGEIKL